jgi:predicted nuclease of predicted toxin-antitoxin system
MNFKIDENLPIDLGELFTAHGHNAVTVLSQHLGGASDEDIAKICSAENRALVTLDIDFADIRTYPPEYYPGIIVLRLKHQDKLHVIQIAERLLRILPKESLDKHLWIVEEEKIRIRGSA